MKKEFSLKISNIAFICACLVVFIHSPISKTHYGFLEKFFKDILSRVAVPTFFMISGFLLAQRVKDEGWYGKAIKKRIKSLLMPLIILDVIWFPIKYGIHWLGVAHYGADGSSDAMKLTVYNVLSGIGIIPWGNTVVIGMWYVKALFLLVCISPILKWAVTGRRRMLLSLAFVFILLVSYNTLNGYDVLWLNPRCPFFFMIGLALHLHGGLDKVGRLSTIALPIALVSCYIVNGNPSLTSLVLRAIFYPFSVIAMAIILWAIIPAKEWPRHLVGNAFPIFVLHGMLLYLLPLPFKVVGVWEKVVNVLGPIPIGVGVIIMALITAMSVRHMFPKFSMLVFGGR